MKTKITIIEPDRRIRRLLLSLLAEQYTVVSAGSINEGYSLIADSAPDIIILDPLYPEKDGIAFIKSVREWSDCQIIALSSNGTERAAVTAIEAGADDFVRKPFFNSELIARIEACKNRSLKLKAAKGVTDNKIYQNSGLKFSFEQGALFLEGSRIHLTKNEFKIFTLLCQNAGKVITYDVILKAVWGPKADSNTGILRVNITNLRKKIEKNPLEPQYLFTENGIGYRVAENEADT